MLASTPHQNMTLDSDLNGMTTTIGKRLAELIKPDTVKGFTVGPQSVMHFLPWFSALRFDSKIYNTFFSPSYLTPITGKQTLFGTQVVSGQLSKRSWLGPWLTGKSTSCCLLVQKCGFDHQKLGLLSYRHWHLSPIPKKAASEAPNSSLSRKLSPTGHSRADRPLSNQRSPLKGRRSWPLRPGIGWPSLILGSQDIKKSSWPL